MVNRDTPNAYLFLSIMQHYMVKRESMIAFKTHINNKIFIIKETKMQEICYLKYLTTSEHHSADPQ